MLTFYESAAGAFADGRFGVDIVKHGHEVTVRYFTQSRRVPLPPSSSPDVFVPRAYYQAFPKRAACFPFSFTRTFDRAKFSRIPGNVWIQFLARKRDERWCELIMAQYDAYLSGVPNPSSFSLFRRVQEWAAVKINEIAGWAEGGVIIPQTEQKEQEDGFQVSIRIAIQEDRRSRMPLIRFVEALLSPLADMNEFEVVSTSKRLLSYMEERTFSPEDKRDFLLCTSEIRAFFPDAIYEDEPLLLEHVPEEIATEEIRTPRADILPAAPVEESEKPDVEAEQSKRKLEKAMRKIGILDGKLEVVSMVKGPTLQQITVKLPRGMKFNDLSRQRMNLQTELGKEEITITQGSQPGTAALLFPRDTRDIVWLEPILASEAFQQYTKEHDLAFVAGVDIIGQPIFDSLTRFHYALVTGAKGGGKTEFTMGMLYTLLSYNSPDMLQVTIIDPKRIDFSFFNIGFPHITGVITDTEEAIETLEGLTDEMEERYEQLEKAGVRSPKAYREKTKQSMPYKVVLVDEYADLFIQDKSVEEFIVRLGNKARACGIFVILCTQRPSADIVTGKIKGNFLTRFCFNLPAHSDYHTVFGKQMNPCLLGKGDGLAMIEGKNGYIRFQSPLLAGNETELEKKLSALKERWVNTRDQEEKDQEEQMAKLLAYIEQTGETRIREIQKYMGVRTVVAQDMMQKLVLKGALLAPDEKNPRYRLAKSENNMT
ncbi:DNA translocase FtsK [Aneurinibacillus danicus]|uniref:FtsK domain-containing protein n=1 Tax=Aneurinibacillus danicus TaxID=267746 RepID=A0A511VAI2_9BACL|nr:DNA translocase FtsK [Aneurinibacillus danicus]GEN35930.1 hypothetical protein ADA01nite_33900 [Aneurinibacillus danicus]